MCVCTHTCVYSMYLSGWVGVYGMYAEMRSIHHEYLSECTTITEYSIQ